MTAPASRLRATRLVRGSASIGVRMVVFYQAALLLQQHRMPLVSAILAAVGLAPLAGFVRTRVDLGWRWAAGPWLVGDEVRMALDVTNPSRRSSAPLQLTLSMPGTPDVVLPVPGLGPREHITLVWEGQPPQRRGPTPWKQASAVNNRLVGKRVGSGNVGYPLLPVVRPRPDLPPAHLLATLTHPAEDGVGSGRRGAVDPLQMRRFVTGDLVSSVHWRSTARAGAPVVLDREQPTVACVVLLVCGTPPLRPLPPEAVADDPWEQCVARAAGLVAAAQATGVPVRVVSADGDLPATAAPDAIHDWLAGLGATPAAEPADLTRAARLAEGGVVAVLSAAPSLPGQVRNALGGSGAVLDLAAPWEATYAG